MTIIGDVHGKVNQYREIVDGCEFSICVGDFGFKEEWDWYTKNITGNGIHDINFGNHDYYPYLNIHQASTRNWNFYPSYQLFTVRGADSIDKHLRTEGIDWFANEELTYQEGLDAFDIYSESKPKIVISHDCPQSIAHTLFGITDKSSTRQLLQAMLDEHKPEIWVFGHHHKSKDVDIFGTRFVCLAELETLTLDI